MIDEDAAETFFRSYVDKHWISLWRRVNQGGLVLHQKQMALVITEAYLAYTLAGSAETGGEKAAPQPDSDLEQVISLIRQVTGPTGGWLISPADFGNQIVQTLYNREADSREPERLNNAQESDEDEICAKCRHCSHEGRCGMRESECQSSCDCVALAESSPGSPPPEECDEFRGNDPKACSTCQRPVQDHRCIVWPVEYLTREEVEKRYPRK